MENLTNKLSMLFFQKILPQDGLYCFSAIQIFLNPATQERFIL